MIRKSEVVTGAFILLALVVLGTLAVTPFNKLFGSTGRREFVAYFDDVALLQNRARVAVNGLDVGVVQSLETDQLVEGDRVVNTVVKVVFTVDEDVAEKFRAGTVATVQQESLLGAKFVKILPSLEGDELPVEEGRYRIPTLPFSDMFTKLGELKDKVDPALEKVSTLLDKLNDGLLSDTNLKNIESLIANSDGLVVDMTSALRRLDENVNGDDGLFVKMDGLVHELEDTLRQVRRDLGEVKQKGLSTLDNVDILLDKSGKAVDDVAALLTDDLGPRIGKVADSADRVLVKVEGRLDGTLDRTDATLESAQALLQNPDLYGSLYEMRRLLQELQLLTKSLKADPSQIIFGGPGVAEEGVTRARDEDDQRRSGRGKRYGY